MKDRTVILKDLESRLVELAGKVEKFGCNCYITDTDYYYVLGLIGGLRIADVLSNEEYHAYTVRLLEISTKK